jgi:hypothetical protein
MTAGQHHRSSLILHFLIINTPQRTTALPEREFAMLWQWLPAALKKKLKKSKKTYTVFVYIKMYKSLLFFVFPKKILYLIIWLLI